MLIFLAKSYPLFLYVGSTVLTAVFPKSSWYFFFNAAAVVVGCFNTSRFRSLSVLGVVDFFLPLPGFRGGTDPGDSCTAWQEIPISCDMSHRFSLLHQGQDAALFFNLKLNNPHFRQCPKVPTTKQMTKVTEALQCKAYLNYPYNLHMKAGTD